MGQEKYYSPELQDAKDMLCALFSSLSQFDRWDFAQFATVLFMLSCEEEQTEIYLEWKRETK